MGHSDLGGLSPRLTDGQRAVGLNTFFSGPSSLVFSLALDTQLEAQIFVLFC